MYHFTDVLFLRHGFDKELICYVSFVRMIHRFCVEGP